MSRLPIQLIAVNESEKIRMCLALKFIQNSVALKIAISSAVRILEKGVRFHDERIFNDRLYTAQAADPSVGSTDPSVKTVIVLGDWVRTALKASLAIMGLFAMDFLYPGKRDVFGMLIVQKEEAVRHGRKQSNK